MNEDFSMIIVTLCGMFLIMTGIVCGTVYNLAIYKVDHSQHDENNKYEKK